MPETITITVDDTTEVVTLGVSGQLTNIVVNNLTKFCDLITASTPGKWIITGDFTLTSNKTIPTGVTLVFNGGVIDLDTFALTGTYTQIHAGVESLFDASA